MAVLAGIAKESERCGASWRPNRLVNPIRYAVAAVIASSALSHAADSLAPPNTAEPLRVFNLNPFHTATGPPPSRGARVLPQNQTEIVLSLDAASYFSEYKRDGEWALVDGETYRPSMALSRGFGRGWEAFVEAPVIMHRGGVFDGFIEGWHDFFGLPQGGRKDAPRDRLAVHYRKDGEALIDLNQNATAMGDLTLGVGYQLPTVPSGLDGIALRAAIQLPTGDEAVLSGRGKAGLSLSAATSGALPWAMETRRWLWFARLGAVFADVPKPLDALDHRPSAFGGLGVSWQPLNRLRLVAQVDAQASPYVDAEAPQLADPVILLSFGGAVRVSRHSEIEIAIVEDDGTRHAAADVGLRLAWRWRTFSSFEFR